ncbi:large exoinvolved in heme utilization/adhesion domain protein [Burkholderia pseudomallei A79C]|nr:large exoinvolved in heme utilization/adhesion domain protein [Burkholderia pseudomallei A79C]
MVRSSHHVQGLRVSLSVNLYGAGQQIHLIDIGRIEPRADHRNQALVDVETRERAVGPEVRIAGSVARLVLRKPPPSTTKPA